jgi:hypothetical protein
MVLTAGVQFGVTSSGYGGDGDGFWIFDLMEY